MLHRYCQHKKKVDSTDQESRQLPQFHDHKHYFLEPGQSIIYYLNKINTYNCASSDTQKFQRYLKDDMNFLLNFSEYLTYYLMINLAIKIQRIIMKLANTFCLAMRSFKIYFDER